MRKHCPYLITLFSLLLHLRALGDGRPRLGPGPGISTPWSEGDTFESPEENQQPQFVIPEEGGAVDTSPLAKQLSFPPIFGEPGYTQTNERPKMPLVFFAMSRALGKVLLKGKRAVAVVSAPEDEAPSFLPSIGAEPGPATPLAPAATTAKQEADEVEPQSPGDITRDRSLISQIETEEAQRQATAKRGRENGTSRRLLQNLKSKAASAAH